PCANHISVNEWVELHDSRKMSLEELAAMRHQEIAPVKELSRSGVTLVRRPNERVKFCQSVVTRANNIATALVLDQDWRRIFNDVQDSHVRQYLQGDPSQPLEGLLE